MKNSSPAELGTRSIGSLLWEYSLPAIIASTVTSLYNIVDSIFIGQGVGALAITGLAITFPMMNLVIAFAMLIAVGGATISSIFLGQKDDKKATNVLHNVVVLSLIHSVIFGGLSLLFIDKILTIFGATAETLPYAHDFMFIVLLGTPVAYVFIALNNVMRATGYPKKAMISALLSVFVNIMLCPLFIFVFGWGIRGAAMATLCGQTAALIWVLSHFLSKRSYVRFSRSARWFVPSLIKKIYAIGLSPFLINTCACVVVVFINKSLLEYGGADGNMAVGAYGVINRVTMLFLMIVLGVTQGMQPILGYNYGAGQWQRVKKTLWLGICAGTAITFLGFIITEIFPDWVTMLFTDDATLLRLSREGFRIVVLCFPILGAAIVIQNFFQSIGMPQLSIFLSVTRQMLFLLPLLLWLPRMLGLNGVWASMAGSDLISFVVTIVTLIVVQRKLNKKFADKNA
ncbi:MAG: MATE family efflux transporter [Bacteroides sp.]|nr:MATE family efflux transporter [Bacteroides sp.]MCM1378719.1 MATE family efflux transporter [Bacteroides sp.]MCM1444992.1 MATE family efflux transporter [Prevotella sp.]